MNEYEISTERLLLRQWCDSDYLPFADLNADPTVMEFFPSVLTRAASDASADRIRVGIAERGWGLWAVEVKRWQRFIGFVGLNPVPEAIPGWPGVEIGWRLAKPHWGNGYATEAAEAVLGFAFKTIHLNEVVSFTAAINHRSRRVMERVGLAFVEAFQHPHLPHDSPLKEHVLYRLAAGDWRARSERARR